jgi:maleamate amidohydrolase
MGAGESLHENYARGGFGQRLAPGRRPALLVIDFVRAYLVPGSPLYAGSNKLAPTAHSF